MTSRIGNDRGFSFIELMVTLSFVVLGSLLIQGSFMRAADVSGRYSHTLKAMAWADREKAKAQEALLYTRGEESGDGGGTLELGEKSCEWSRKVKTGGGPNLYDILLELHWTESGRPQQYKNETYVYKKETTQNL